MPVLTKLSIVDDNDFQNSKYQISLNGIKRIKYVMYNLNTDTKTN